MDPKVRLFIFSGILIIILIIGFLIIQGLKKETAPKFKLTMSNLFEKKIAFIIAFRDFRDEEYFIPKKILETAGAETITCSTEKGKAIGADGGEVMTNFTLENLKVSDFDAIIFIGGPGAIEYLDNEKSYKIARETVKADKVLGAICIAPTILAKAGVLEEKEATVWSSALNRGPIEILKEGGAIYRDKEVVVDGKIVTANGPEAAEKFGQALVEVLR